MLDHLAQASPGVTGYEQRQNPNEVELVPTAPQCLAHPCAKCIPNSLPMGNAISLVFISIKGDAQGLHIPPQHMQHQPELG